MALIVKETMREIMEEIKKETGNDQHYRYFGSRQDVQEQFCQIMEWGDAEDFFQHPEIKAYLESCGIRYRGHYTLESDDVQWGGERFVTFLNYPLQLACLALYNREIPVIVKAGRGIYDPAYLIPVCKKRDVYLLADRFNDFFYEERKGGVEVRAAGRSSAELSDEEFTSFLVDQNRRWQYLTREVDAEVFPEDYREKYLFEPTQATLADYLRRYGEAEEDAARAPDIRVLVNGKNNFDGTWRKYPIHALFWIEGKWRYAASLSVKNPTLGELLEDAVFCDAVWDLNGDGKERTDVSAAEKVFALVLDCDETCDVRKYWEQAAFVAKYDKAGGVLEICDLAESVLEFHELLQQSGDLNDPRQPS